MKALTSLLVLFLTAMATRPKVPSSAVLYSIFITCEKMKLAI